jgi:hypothetical protein
MCVYVWCVFVYRNKFNRNKVRNNTTVQELYVTSINYKHKLIYVKVCNILGQYNTRHFD